MRILLFSLFSFTLLEASSQQGVSVMYERVNRMAPITINGEVRELPSQKFRLVFNDSLSFFYFIGNGSDPYRKKSLFGHKLVHHATYYRNGSPVVAFGVDQGAKKKYLVIDTLIPPEFPAKDDIRNILGFPCKAALMVNEKNDTTLVWYAPDIQVPYGPFAHIGFPGLVLEVIDQRYSGNHIVATRVEEGNYVLAMPENVPEIPRSQWQNPKNTKPAPR